LLIVE